MTQEELFPPLNPKQPKQNRFRVFVDGKNVTKRVPFPVKWANLLDERLDEARITVQSLSDKLIEPLTPVDIYMEYDGTMIEKHFLVATDSAREVPIGKRQWDHEMYLIEETKYLEGFICSSISFTNDLGRLYTDGAPLAKPNNELLLFSSVTGLETSWPVSKWVHNPSLRNSSLNVPPAKDLVVPDKNFVGTKSSREIIVDGQSLGLEEDEYTDGTSKEIQLTGQRYEIKYYAKLNGPSSSGTMISGNFSYGFITIENEQPLPRWNIRTVIERVLEVVEPLLEGQTPRFTLNPAQAAELEKIESPEFAFTRSTLREILEQIGGYIHAMPRLRGNEIYYDDLGGTDLAPVSQLPYAQNISTQDIESFATGLDSSTDNLVNLMSYAEGVIIEPYAGGFKTLRTENANVRIEEGNMFIETKYPIWNIVSVKCGYIPGADYKGGDITPYVFEAADYQRMSSYSSSYPDSKSYALYYTQGERNIKGLTFKVDDATSQALKQYAIINILEAATERNVSVPAGKYPALAFQVSYIPIYSARVRQTKANVVKRSRPRTLAYNQSANLIETRYYGENMKGVIARLGNVERTVTVYFHNYKYIPKAGQMYDDDYYIAAVFCELNPMYIKCTLNLSKDFNRLSQYIGINSMKRQYEISEKQAFQRDINYTDYIVIGNPEKEDTTLVTDYYGMRTIKDIFEQSNSEAKAVTFVTAQGKTEQGNPLARMRLPVISSSFGTAMVFGFSYEDNYSAGQQSIYAVDYGKDSSGKAVSGYFSQGTMYTDPYGRMHALELSMAEYGAEPVNAERQEEKGNELPADDGGVITSGIPISTLLAANLLLRKESTEVPSITYELEFVSNRSGIIIGSALARNCSLVRGWYEGHSAKMYILPRRLYKFANIVDVAGATQVADFSDGEGLALENKTITFTPIVASVAGQSWAIVDQATNELLIGENGNIAEGDEINLSMTAVHNIFE